MGGQDAAWLGAAAAAAAAAGAAEIPWRVVAFRDGANDGMARWWAGLPSSPPPAVVPQCNRVAPPTAMVVVEPASTHKPREVTFTFTC